MKKFTAEEQIRLRDFTDNVYPQGSFAFSRLLRDRDIRVNGKKTGENLLLMPGDEVVYYTTQKEEAKKFCDILYEDENLLVADKYAGVNAEALCLALSSFGVRAVHRLDRNTVGLTAFAKNDAAEGELLSAFRQRRVEKIYEAICFHPFRKSADILTAYLVKDAHAAKVSLSLQEKKGAEKIVTEYFAAENKGELARVKIRLHSGKTHQIRAHMAFIGHPVAGDEKYGDEVLNKKYRLKRQLLVAKSLSFAFTGVLSYLNGKTFESSFSAEYPVLQRQ